MGQNSSKILRKGLKFSYSPMPVEWNFEYTFFIRTRFFSVETRCSSDFRRHEAQMILICSYRCPDDYSYEKDEAQRS